MLAAVVPGGLMVFVMHEGQQAELAQREGERLDAFVQTAAEMARAGRPLDQAMQQSGPLAGRVLLVDAQGQAIAGPTTSVTPRVERPVQVDGRTVATAKIVRPPELSDQDRRVLATQYIGVAAIVVVLFVLLLVMAYVFARRWAKPQLQLYGLSRDVVNGDLDLYFDEDGPAEVVATMRNLRRIASQFSRLETARRTWLVSISGELKGPTENMGEHFIKLCEVQPPLEPALIGAIEEDTRRLIHMAEDLNAVALADLGRLPVTFASVDPRALIHNAIYADKKRAEAQGVRLETSTLPEYTVIVKWDGARIEQLFSALIDNSLRYTPRNGRIVLGLESSRDAWRLIIDDNAPGVDVMLAQRLFEPFYRSSDRSDESAASGLGLATARAIVEAHHGRIEASRSPIGGLRVTVILPGNPPTA
ncbi:ATP-binding protein [Sphingomonas sp. HITSZ_GF]|uniref:sensor histidine kinase n=1 Tax=Sphingomonas sp. HITSZ_GF TaxID=3037247 RepID=UPI00240D87F6|nr:ATP-binding protein [Sphingomonas sp. HITSZ_GF]MDG2532856.1 ATP-binding protein [Sphingomonas sp. HITSZ_GF]